MESEVFNIGDVVSLKSHAYLKNITTIIISGEPLLLPPLLVVTEKVVVLAPKKENIAQDESLEYVCRYFSSKLHTFENIKIKAVHLKLIIARDEASSISEDEVFPGAMVTLKSMDYELAKKKSSFTFEDTSLNHGSDNTTISALLTNLCPTLHVISIKEHVTKHPTHNKEKQIRQVPSWDVKCFWYNSHKEKFSEEIFPLEALKIVVPVREEDIEKILEIIAKSSVLEMKGENGASLIKPRLITNRSGYYFLRGYDYILNRITENKIAFPNTFAEIQQFILNKVPLFDLRKNPASANQEFVINEIKQAVITAKDRKNYIRIQYKSRHDILTVRTIRSYEIVETDEDGKRYEYVIGFCCLRMDERSFRIDRIQQLEELNFTFKTEKTENDTPQ